MSKSKSAQAQLSQSWAKKILDSLDKKDFADVIFLVGPLGDEIFAHKLILSAGSPVFETMFNCRWNSAEKLQMVELPDVDPIAFRLFLKFLYSQCKLSHKEINQIPVENLLDVIYIARKYEIPYVVDNLLRALQQRLNVDNAIKIFQQAQDFGESQIEKGAFDFIVRRLSEILETNQFNSLRQPNLCRILQIDDLDIKEVSLFQAACRWAAAECKRMNLEVTPANYRKVLGNALDLIRFPTMKSEDLTFQVSNCGILTSDEMVEILKFVSLPLESRKNMRASSLKYNVTPRKGSQNDLTLHRCKRHGVFQQIFILHSDSWYQTCFTVDQRIVIKGLELSLAFHDQRGTAVFDPSNGNDSEDDAMDTDAGDACNNNHCDEEIEVNIDISQTDNNNKAFVTCGKVCRQTCLGTPLTYVHFDNPVEIQPNIIHTISYMFRYKQKDMVHHLTSLGDAELNVSPVEVKCSETAKTVRFEFLVTKGNDFPYLECPIREITFSP